MKRRHPLILLTLVITVGLVPLRSTTTLAHSLPTPHHTSMIIDGEDAKPGEFPWMVALAQNGKPFCGGALIDKDWVLTAAHCFYTEPKSDNEKVVQDTFEGDFQVVLGTIDLTDGSGQSVKVEKIIDPGYDGKIHDIALLKLAEPANIDDKTIAPIEFYSSDSTPKNGTLATATGWGATNADGTGDPAVLQKINVALVDCAAEDGVAEYLCARGKQSKDTCQGDSGGPLIVPAEKDSEKFVEIGITSFGNETCDGLGDYTRISTYAKWVAETMEKDTSGK